MAKAPPLRSVGGRLHSLDTWVTRRQGRLVFLRPTQHPMLAAWNRTGVERPNERRAFVQGRTLWRGSFWQRVDASSRPGASRLAITGEFSFGAVGQGASLCSPAAPCRYQSHLLGVIQKLYSNPPPKHGRSLCPVAFDEEQTKETIIGWSESKFKSVVYCTRCFCSSEKSIHRPVKEHLLGGDGSRALSLSFLPLRLESF